MKYQQILHAVFAQPWLIKPAAHATIRKLVLARIANSDPPKREDGVDICGDAVEAESMEVVDGVARIPVGGILARKVTAFERGAGVVDTMDVTRDLRWADKSKDVRAILLDIDSPGGIINGTPELADAVAAVDKPIVAFSANKMASAAYWIAAGADQIYATKSAEIGSIGVYTYFLDESARLAEDGLKLDVFASGKYKGLGIPGTTLSDEQRNLLQSEVDGIANQFKEHVLQYRPAVPADTMEGQAFFGVDAVKYGLIDGVVSDQEELISML